MFKEIVDDGRRTPDIGRSQKLTMSTSCSGELKIIFLSTFVVSTANAINLDQSKILLFGKELKVVKMMTKIHWIWLKQEILSLKGKKAL